MKRRVFIETERLVLGEWLEWDWRAFLRLARNRRVVRYVTQKGALWERSRAQEFIERQRRHQHAHGFCMWRLEVGEEGFLGGFCGLQRHDFLRRIEIGWWLRPDLWGQGLATEAAGAVLEKAFEAHGLKDVAAMIHVENKASRRVAEKADMRFERRTIYHSLPVVIYGSHGKLGCARGGIGLGSSDVY